MAELSAEKSKIEVMELPAPQGWQKKVLLKKGGTPRRNEIIFISPTGEEIKNKRQLTQYLKSHPGGPESSEFYWGTGDTPRRSARLGEKTKAVESPEDEKPKKRERKSSSKKGEEDNKDEEDPGKAKEDVTKEEAEDADVEMKEAKDVADAEMKETDDARGKVGEGVGALVTDNKDATVEVDVNRSALVEIATEDAANEPEIEQDSANKTEEDVCEQPVEFTTENDATKDATNSDIFDVKPTELNKDANMEMAGDYSAPLEIATVVEDATNADQTYVNKDQTDLKPTELNKDADMEVAKDVSAPLEIATVVEDATTADISDFTIDQTDAKPTELNKDANIEVAKGNSAPSEIATGVVDKCAIEQDSENITKGDVGEEPVESAVKKDETEDATNDYIFVSNVSDDQIIEVKPTESAALNLTNPKEVSSAENGEKGEVASENGNHQGITLTNEAPSVVYNGQHPPKASPTFVFNW